MARPRSAVLKRASTRSYPTRAPRVTSRSDASATAAPTRVARRLSASIWRSRSSRTSRYAKPAETTSVASQMPPSRRTRKRMRLSSELRQPLGVGYRERHQMMGGNRAERADRARALRERGDRVRTEIATPQQRGHRLPAVTDEDRRRGVVARHHENVGSQRTHLRHVRIEALEGGHLRVEVAVLARLVGVLVMHEEEVVRLPVLAERRDLALERPTGLQHVHADELGEAAIHRIGRDGCPAEAVDLRKARQLRQLAAPAQ